MFGPNHYVPHLLTKRGEMTAVKNLSANARAKMTPIFSAHGKDPAGVVVKYWGVDRCFVTGGSTAEVAGFAAQCQALGVDAIPLLDPALIDPSIAALVSSGLGLRVSPGFNLASALSAASSLGLPQASLDLVVDFQGAPAALGATYASYLQTICGGIPSVGAWRTLTVLGTAFPTPLKGKSGTSFLLDRWCMRGWSSLTGLVRRPSFGDYTVVNPFGGPLPDPRMLNVAAKIKYATQTAWLIERGHGTKGKGFGQYKTLATSIVGSPHWVGVKHCWGCARLHQHTLPTSTSGSHETWVQVAVSHHLELTATQV